MCCVYLGVVNGGTVGQGGWGGNVEGKETAAFACCRRIGCCRGIVVPPRVCGRGGESELSVLRSGVYVRPPELSCEGGVHRDIVFGALSQHCVQRETP